MWVLERVRVWPESVGPRKNERKSFSGQKLLYRYNAAQNHRQQLTITVLDTYDSTQK